MWDIVDGLFASNIVDWLICTLWWRWSTINDAVSDDDVFIFIVVVRLFTFDIIDRLFTNKIIDRSLTFDTIVGSSTLYIIDESFMLITLSRSFTNNVIVKPFIKSFQDHSQMNLLRDHQDP